MISIIANLITYLLGLFDASRPRSTSFPECENFSFYQLLFQLLPVRQIDQVKYRAQSQIRRCPWAVSAAQS
jgi:hypothetical protein